MSLGEIFALAERREGRDRIARELERQAGLARVPAIPRLNDRRAGRSADVARIEEGSSRFGRRFSRTSVAARARSRSRVRELELDLTACHPGQREPEGLLELLRGATMRAAGARLGCGGAKKGDVATHCRR